MMSMKVKTTSKIGSPAECKVPSPFTVPAGPRPLPARILAATTQLGKQLQVSRTFFKTPAPRPAACCNQFIMNDLTK
jgi:hypothetical protein